MKTTLRDLDPSQYPELQAPLEEFPIKPWQKQVLQLVNNLQILAHARAIPAEVAIMVVREFNGALKGIGAEMPTPEQCQQFINLLHARDVAINSILKASRSADEQPAT